MVKKVLGFLILFLLFGISYEAHASEQTFSIDSFTVKQGEEALINYLKDKNMDYQVGSEDFINTVNSLAENNIGFEGYNYDLLSAYASIYSSEFEKNLDTSLNYEIVSFFSLDSSIENMTIEEIRNENIKKNLEIEDQINKEQTIDSSLPKMQAKAVTGSSGFSPTAAKNYMKTHWDTTSSKRYNYYGGSGGDCTNYVSQVLYAGGMGMTGSFEGGYPNKRPTTKYWYSKLNKWGYIYNTTSWMRVTDFYSYWVGTKKHTVSKYSTAKSASKYANTGDVIQFYKNSTGSWYHTVVVYDRDGANGTIRYSSHSDAHLHKSLSNVEDSSHDFRVIFFN
ncbi:amidase domain-containing protein [Niallia taxi]|uniref:amidase domain-containing protein n=1 Tax=Niallia taxi TaxID=2499688 RepID=UPI00203F569A|nr:amidase domain-containing protein [Niallia taxi]MCM3216825.1 amidase domain-containing protein [Niallia taxi]